MVEVEDCGGKVVDENLERLSRTDDVKIKLSSPPCLVEAAQGSRPLKPGAAMQPSALKTKNKTLDGV